jgi:hypothetical protein
MVMRILTSTLGATAALLATALVTQAQCVDQRLPIGGSTRGLAMGDASTASRDDDVIFYGPAQLAVARGTSASAERYFDRLASGTVSTTSRLSSGGIGVGAQVIEGRNVESCTQVTVGPNGTFIFSPAPRTISRTRAVVGAAQTFKRIHFGAAAKYAAAQMDDQRTSRFLFDAGASRDFTVRDFIPLTAALAVQNIGTSATDTTQLITPLRAALGLASGGPVGPFDLAVALQLAVEQNGTSNIFREGRFIPGLGAELGYTWLEGYTIAVRAGERTPPTRTDLRHFTFGAGLTLDRISFDYAAEDQVGFRVAHRIGIRLR